MSAALLLGGEWSQLEGDRHIRTEFARRMCLPPSSLVCFLTSEVLGAPRTGKALIQQLRSNSTFTVL